GSRRSRAVILPVRLEACFGSVRRTRPLKKDPQSQILRAAMLEQLDRGVEIDVMPHRKSAGRACLIPGPLELFRTPPLDALHLGLVDHVDVSRRHAFLS